MCVVCEMWRTGTAGYIYKLSSPESLWEETDGATDADGDDAMVAVALAVRDNRGGPLIRISSGVGPNVCSIGPANNESLPSSSPSSMPCRSVKESCSCVSCEYKLSLVSLARLPASDVAIELDRVLGRVTFEPLSIPELLGEASRVRTSASVCVPVGDPGCTATEYTEPERWTCGRNSEVRGSSSGGTQ